MAGEDFEPLITVGGEGILYMSVGLVEVDDGSGELEQGMVDHPVFFCPFCGTKLQDAEAVRQKIEALDEAEA